MGHAPPVLKLALALVAGAAWVPSGAPAGLAPIAVLVFLLWPIDASARRMERGLWVVAAGAGFAAAAVAQAAPGCGAAPGGQVAIEGRFLAAPRTGAGPFVPSSRCGVVTVVLADSGVPAGRLLRVDGTWRAGTRGPWFQARHVARPSVASPEADWIWGPVRWRQGLVRRLERLYGPQAPLVSALTLARREGLEPEVREAFARVGIAHLLAISGFHVGVIAGAVLAILRLAVGRRPAVLGAAGAAWVYVGFIGFPDAACRAALILSLVAVSRARARPPARWGSLGAALLILVAHDPRRVAQPGFQLSFAGAAGLVAWAGPLGAWMRRRCGRRCPRWLSTGVSAGIAATAATLPFVAWHFDRVSLVGIPATLVATPLVVLALTGSLATLVLDLAWPASATFLAGGVSSVVWLLEEGARLAAGLTWASAWVTRGTVIAGTLGLATATYVARRPRVGPRTRRLLVSAYALAAILAWPPLLSLQGRGTVELLMIDVGQGDAIAVRGPTGRWLLVDAGPAHGDSDPRSHPAVRALKARGVQRLDALVLTHPDLDHIGGATAVLSELDVGTIYDPGVPAGKEAFVGVLDEASRRGVPWRAARAGDRIEIEGLDIDVLHPRRSMEAVEANAMSVVLHVRLGDFDALLTGDAYTDVERRLLGESPNDFEVLKVGHHGSDTSTDSLLLARTRPDVALISVGRYNRYGHPSPTVLRRLEGSGARVRRTDREGTISVVGRRDGSYSVTSLR